VTAVVVALTVAVVLLGVLVAGLLRSHAEILRTLHQLGAGLEDGRPATESRGLGLGPTRLGAVGPAGSGGAAHDVSGVTPQGTAVHVAVAGTGRVTLLAFLTSGCTTCGDFWDTFNRPGGFEVPGYVDRLVVVTKGVDRESPAEVLARAPKPSAGVPVVMSGEAWTDYEVPVSPYFVLVDGATDRVAGEGAARSWAQLESLLARAVADRSPTGEPTASPTASPTATPAGGSAGADPAAARSRPRVERADDALAAAGIEAGHPSLHPGPGPAARQ
jgi:hypothetical protein